MRHAYLVSTRPCQSAGEPICSFKQCRILAPDTARPSCRTSRARIKKRDDITVISNKESKRKSVDYAASNQFISTGLVVSAAVIAATFCMNWFK